MSRVSTNSALLPEEDLAGMEDAAEPETSKIPALGAAERQVVAIFVQLAQSVGAPRSLGEIYGLLFATPVPLSSQDIVERLKISKGSVSQGLRFLRTWGAIKSVVVVGDRREFFEPVVELRQLVGGFIRERIQPEIDLWKERAGVLKEKDFAASGDEQRKVMAARLSKLQTWPGRARTVLPVVARLLG
ncbi:transcriptional regulator [Opitutaceae bacterium TAV4]|uniref:GbsR/MarR family transcriptional regulator n=1 Tax=Geminisphaera colitermitum TaxID=1148786 RepID=UPI000158CF97|nr:transcriptional regulator [Geminisphaera colitermitum]RRJ94512.1 transcriptional regulator [Opitutaceae bacterium TAV4]RRJ98574.1 transcriptional regulator [Opitutaceae bacterium TAV3]